MSILYAAVTVHRGGGIRDDAAYSKLDQKLFNKDFCRNFINDVGAAGQGSIDGNGRAKLTNGQKVTIRYHVQQSKTSHDIYHMCATNRDAKYTFAYAFLNDVDESPIASTDLQELMDQWNTSPPLSKMDKLKRQITKLKAVLDRNLSAMGDRGETLSKLESKSERISEASSKFEDGSNRVKKKFCWQKWKWYIMIGGGLATIILIIVLVVVISNAGSSRRRLLESLMSGDTSMLLGGFPAQMAPLDLD